MTWSLRVLQPLALRIQERTSLRRAPRVLVALVALLALVACTNGTSPTVDPGLGSARIAVSVSYQDSDLGDGHGGALILVAADGTVRSIATSGMDTMQLAWTGSAIAYSDQQNDYLLGARLDKQPRKTDESSQVSIEAEGDGARAVFNTGQGEDGYETGVTTFGGSGSKSETLTSLTIPGRTRAASPCPPSRTRSVTGWSAASLPFRVPRTDADWACQNHSRVSTSSIGFQGSTIGFGASPHDR